ncbi:hypothetical protein [Streptomyces sp. YGL11-2]|uniref:hypothetical protein n=1 Tax=Streptomyces sp. YGL11-2 TaxID=3414028 RepID=UPI003CE933EE
MTDLIAAQIQRHRNNTACSVPGVVEAEGFDGFGRTCPSSMLDGLTGTLGLPSVLGHGVADNIACEGQIITFDHPVATCGLHVVGAGSGGAVNEVFRLGETEVRVGLSDFLSPRSVFNDTLYARSPFLRDIGGRDEYGAHPSLWLSVVRLPQHVTCQEIELPVNPDLHVFALWLATR